MPQKNRICLMYLFVYLSFSFVDAFSIYAIAHSRRNDLFYSSTPLYQLSYRYFACLKNSTPPPPPPPLLLSFTTCICWCFFILFNFISYFFCSLILSKNQQIDWSKNDGSGCFHFKWSYIKRTLWISDEDLIWYTVIEYIWTREQYSHLLGDVDVFFFIGYLQFSSLFHSHRCCKRQFGVWWCTYILISNRKYTFNGQTIFVFFIPGTAHLVYVIKCFTFSWMVCLYYIIKIARAPYNIYEHIMHLNAPKIVIKKVESKKFLWSNKGIRNCAAWEWAKNECSSAQTENNIQNERRKKVQILSEKINICKKNWKKKTENGMWKGNVFSMPQIPHTMHRPSTTTSVTPLKLQEVPSQLYRCFRTFLQ